MSVPDTGQPFDGGLQPMPEADGFEHRVHEVRHRAVVGVLRVGVVQRVLPRTQEDPAILQAGHEGTDLGARLVRPFVHLVGVDADDHEEPDLPRQRVQPGRPAEDRGSDEQEVPGALPPAEPGEVPGMVVVDDIRLDQQRADQRGFLGPISVLQPVNQTRDEVGQQDDAEGLQGDEQCRMHGLKTTTIRLSR